MGLNQLRAGPVRKDRAYVTLALLPEKALVHTAILEVKTALKNEDLEFIGV